MWEVRLLKRLIIEVKNETRGACDELKNQLSCGLVSCALKTGVTLLQMKFAHKEA